MDDFYPHPPRGGRHLAELQNIMMRAISIHALREEGDEAHCGSAKLLQAISIHALREEGDVEVRQAHGDEHISIHALREEGDKDGEVSAEWEENFYPRPPRGGRLTPLPRQPRNSLFLSTPSARRATVYARGVPRRYEISIHALREEGDCCPVAAINPIDDFYPRPPRGGRHVGESGVALGEKFLSTPSARRATWILCL